jgi:hypothetical protein
MADYGFKISISGQDVKTATNSQLILSTKFPFLKAYLQGSGSIYVPSSGTYTVTINHNLGYYPVFVHYFSFDIFTPGKRYFGRQAAQGPTGHLSVESWVSTSQLRLAWKEIGFTTHPYTIYFYYYLFYDKLA